MTTILDGKQLSEKILTELSQDISKLDVKPHLVVILIGDDAPSQLYVSLKKKAAEKIGIKSTVLTYSEAVDEKFLLEKIQELNNDKSVDAILVQLPLPKHLNAAKIIQTISPKKDADCLTPENVGKVSLGLKPYVYPCTPKGILRLMDEYKIDVSGKHVVVIGRSNIVGKPVSQMLLTRNATVTVCHSYTKNLAEITKTADILISAVGLCKLIHGGMVGRDSVVIDVGTSKINGKSVGDVDFDSLSNPVSCMAPVPGGVGPMTIASLMENTFELYKLNRDA